MLIEREEFLGISFNVLTRDQLLALLSEVTDQSNYAYLVTPNVDHVVQLYKAEDRADWAASYHAADLTICDSRVLRLLARSHGLDLPVVPGSDLTVRLFQQVIRPNDKIAVIGGAPAMMSDLKLLYPDVNFVHFNPPMGLRRDPAARQEAAQFIAAAKTRFTLIAVGAPQQEMIAAAVRHYPDARGTALCIGASLDFMTGRQRRAPQILQSLSLEWAYRLWSDPRRLWRRYLVEGPSILALAVKLRPRRGSVR